MVAKAKTISPSYEQFEELYQQFVTDAKGDLLKESIPDPSPLLCAKGGASPSRRLEGGKITMLRNVGEKYAPLGVPTMKADAEASFNSVASIDAATGYWEAIKAKLRNAQTTVKELPMAIADLIEGL